MNPLMLYPRTEPFPIASRVQDSLFFQNTLEQFLQTELSNADSFPAAFSAGSTACLYLSASVYAQITESMMAHTNFHMRKQEEILLHCSEVGNTGAKAPTYSLNCLNCFAVLESEEKLLHQAISESLLSITALEKRLVKLEFPPSWMTKQYC